MTELTEPILLEPKVVGCCPYCKSESLTQSDLEAFVEVGEFNDDWYEQEGDVIRFTCNDCKEQFFVWK